MENRTNNSMPAPAKSSTGMDENAAVKQNKVIKRYILMSDLKQSRMKGGFMKNCSKFCLLTVLIVITSMLLTACCTDNTGKGERKAKSGNAEQVPGAVSKLELDRYNAVSSTLSAKEGGFAGLTLPDNSKVRVMFPPESVEKDVPFSISPVISLPVEDDLTISRGFDIEFQETGSSWGFLFPAVIQFVFDRALPEGASIVKYSNDGKDYLPVRSTITSRDGMTYLTAGVTGFSAYGVRGLTSAEIEAQADRLEEKGFDWVIQIDDKKEGVVSPDGTQCTMIFKMNVVNSGDFFMDDFIGEASFLSVGAKEVGALIPAVGAIEVKDANVEFSLVAPLDPPVKTEDGLTTIEPLVRRDWTSSGKFRFVMSMVGFMGIEMEPDDANQDALEVPYEVSIYGPRVVVTLRIPGFEEMNFRGKIIGHGKK